MNLAAVLVLLFASRLLHSMSAANRRYFPRTLGTGVHRRRIVCEGGKEEAVVEAVMEKALYLFGSSAVRHLLSEDEFTLLQDHVYTH